MSFGLLLVYFGYGLAFWAMGLAVLLESGRSGTGEALSLRWLAGFGLLHGTHEWLEAFLAAAGSVGVGLPHWLVLLRLGLLASSFVCLSAYSITALKLLPAGGDRRHWRYAVPLVSALFLALLLGGAGRARLEAVTFLDAATRYVLAVPAGVLAGLAAWAASRSEGIRRRTSIARNLRVAAAGFGAYGVAQLFVHQQSWFPANVLNQESLLDLTGIPIQAIRGLIAAAIAIGLLRAMQAAERARQAELVAAHQARIAAVEQQDLLRRDLLRHVVRSQEAERARIARELHDDVAQFLAAFSLQLGRLRSRLKGHGTIEVVDELQELSQRMSRSLQGLVRNLRPSHLDNLGLVPAIKYLLNQEFGPQGLNVSFHATGSLRQLPGPVDTALFRIVQESLTNVLRHAGVQAAELDVQYEPRQVLVRICDQGRGFDPAEDFMPPRGWGLAGIRERVEALGGRLSVRSTPARGTTLEVVIPLEAVPPEG